MAALSEVSSEATAATAGSFTQADVDAAVAKELALKEEAHKKELMNVRIQAAKRLAASPRAAAAAAAPERVPVVDQVSAQAAAAGGSDGGAGTATTNVEVEGLRQEVSTLKAEAAKVAGTRTREKMVLVQEIKRIRAALAEKDSAVKQLETDVDARKAELALAKAAVAAAESKAELAAAEAAKAAANSSPRPASPAAVDPNAARLAELSKDLSAQLDAATARADTAQTTIELQHGEIKRLKARIASLEAQLARQEAEHKAVIAEMEDAANTPTPSPRHRAGAGEDTDTSASPSPSNRISKPPLSPAMRRVKRAATPQSTRSLNSESSFGSAAFDTDSPDERSGAEDYEDDDSYAQSPGVDSPRTTLAPQGHSDANASYAADNEREDEDEDEDAGDDMAEDEVRPVQCAH